MLDCFKCLDMKKTGIFAAGVLFGTAKECVMKTANTIQENAEDIYEEAKVINQERAAMAEAEVCEDENEDAEAKEQ